MAATENFALPLPQMGEPADIRVLNRGTEEIDGIMNGNRTMIAPAFDSTKAYVVGDPVVYLGELFVFVADKAAGAWDVSKVEKTTAAEMGGGGASALADLDDVEITSPTDGQALLFDDSDDKWKNQTLPDASVTKEATGNPIELTDAADAPLVKCVTQITGSQDLHGYDKPWVGGAGKNKINAPDITLAGAGDVYNGAISLAAGTWTLSSSNTTVSVTVEGVSGTMPLTFTLADAISTIQIEASGAGTFEDIMIESGSTATTYAPYSNICPITAYTEGEIEVSDGDGNTTTYTTTFPYAIYRGSEDCVNGEVRSEMPLIDLGSLTWYLSNSGKWFYASVIGIKYETQGTQNINIICENYNAILPQTTSDMDNVDNGSVAQRISSNQIMIKDTSYNDPAVFKTAMSGVKLAYELATPTTTPVTPTNLPIRTLSGYNHIESSTGEMEIEYITKTYEPLVELIQSSDHIYSTQEQVVGTWVDGKTLYEKTLYLASASVSSGTPASMPSISGVETVMVMSGSCYDVNDQRYYPLPYIRATDSESLKIQAHVISGTLSTTIFTAQSSAYSLKDMCVVVRYTKASSNNRSLSDSVNAQKAIPEPLTDKTEEVPAEEEKAVEKPVEETEEENEAER